MAICILDVETSGYPGDARSSLLQIGAVLLDGGRETAKFSSLVRPTYAIGPWCKNAMEVNQLDPALLCYAPEPEKVWDSFLSWLLLYTPLEAVLAFNVSFDKAAMIKAFSMAEALPWGRCLMRDSNEILFGKRNSIKLDIAARALGISVNGYRLHDALSDAELAAKIYVALSKNVQYKGPL